MAKETNPKDTTRAMAFELWMQAPNPMVTFFKMMDVTNLIRISKKKRLKFNMLLDYCIGKAAVDVTADTAARAVGKRINKAEFEFTWRESK